MSNPTTVMTERAEPGPSSDLVAHTRKNEPNINVVARPWYVMVLVRVARVYVQSVLGLLTANATGVIDIDNFTKILIGASFPALVSLLQNTVEILSKLDTHEDYSTFRA